MHRGLLLASVALLLGGCQYGRLLFSPASLPPEGGSTTITGPAYAPALFARAAVPGASDWVSYNRTLKGERYVPLSQITTRNVAALRAVCTFTLDHPANMQAGLVEVGDTLFVTTQQDTYAIDAENCALRWKHTYRLARHVPFDPNRVNRGVAYLDGRVFRGANDGRLYALDAGTGQAIWNVAIGDPSVGETFPAAPAAWNGMVFIGNAGGDNFGVTGRMMAFDAATGGHLWTTPLVPTNGLARLTWPPSTAAHPQNGGATWSSYAVDPATGLLYVPTGNAAPDFIPSLRRGTDLYTYGVVVLDGRTGVLRGWHQFLKGDDFHDWDMAAPPELIDTPDGRHLLVAAGKDGYLYVLGADGRLAFKTAVTEIKNADAPLTSKGTHFCPGIDGGVEWNGPAYSPQTNAFYVNAVDWCTTVSTEPAAKLEGRKGLPWTGSRSRLAPFGVRDKKKSGWLTAVSARDGAVLWRFHAPTPLVAGITTTAGGLVFTGDLRGSFIAFDATDGRILYSFDTGQPIGGGVISYAAGGTQYVAVASGMDSPIGWGVHSGPAKIILFALPLRPRGVTR